MMRINNRRRACTALYCTALYDTDLFEDSFGDSPYFTAKFGAYEAESSHPDPEEDDSDWVCPKCGHEDNYENFEHSLCDGCFQDGFSDWKEHLKAIKAQIAAGATMVVDGAGDGADVEAASTEEAENS